MAAITATSVDGTYQEMKRLLSRVVPDAELRVKAELVHEINRRKKERDAIILGHNYMEPALYHTVCDIVGDSLELSRKAAEATQRIIIFCGVKFMAETAKILNPSRTVLLPAKKAGCSLAASITAQDVRNLKAQYPGVPVVTYINVYADVKAETDVCVTSSNAAKIVGLLKEETILFLPDEFLAKNVAQETGKHLIFPGERHTTVDHATEPPTKEKKGLFIAWHGRCEVHEQFTVADIESARAQFPDVTVLAHPECSPEVVAAADYSSSTSKMVQFVRESSGKRFLLLTECSMGDNIIAENPEKEILRLCSIRCPHMNQITLEDTLDALINTRYEIDVPEDIRVRAKRSLDRMLEFSRVPLDNAG